MSTNPTVRDETHQRSSASEYDSTAAAPQQRNDQRPFFERNDTIRQTIDHQRGNSSLPSTILQHSRPLSSHDAAVAGMTFSVGNDSQPVVGSLLHSSFSQRGISTQIQARLLLQVQSEQNRVRHMEDMRRALLIQQEQQLQAARDAIQVEYRRQQEIYRVLHGNDILEHTQRHQPVSVLQPSAPVYNIGAISTLLPNTSHALLHLNQSNYTPLNQGIHFGISPHPVHDAHAANSMVRPLQPPYDVQAIAQAFGRLPTQVTDIPMVSSSLLSFDATTNQINNESHVAAVHPASVPLSLPVLLGHLDEQYTGLSEHQRFARQQIELFAASCDDLATHRRGRNKPIMLGQVGIRCKHCTHVPMKDRQKGSIYFPSTIVGVYQAAQNMSGQHISNGSCHYMPASVKSQFATIKDQRQNSSRCTNNGGRREYWMKSASDLGMIDVQGHGIRFIRSWGRGVDHHHVTAVDAVVQR